MQSKKFGQLIMQSNKEIWSVNNAIRQRNLVSLIEYGMRNIFLEKSYINAEEKLLPKPFLKKSKLSISLNQ